MIRRSRGGERARRSKRRRNLERLRAAEVHGVIIDLDLLVDIIKQGLLDIAQKEVGNYVVQFNKDVFDFIEDNLPKVFRWAELMISGDLTQEEFQFLVAGLEDIVTLRALSEVGIALVALQRIRKAVIDLLISSVLKVAVL